jgi:hypothetical protein
MSRDVRTVLSIVLTSVLLMVAALPALGQTRRTPARPAPKAKPLPPPPAPATPYDQGYVRGYDAGFKAGQDDYGRGTPRDLRNNQVFQNREQNYDPKFADSEEYRQAYTLGVEFGYMDGYYGRTRNTVSPVNGAVLAKAASLAAAQRARREAPRDEYRRDDQARNEPRRDEPRRDEPRRDEPRGNTRASVPLDIPAGTQLNLRLTSRIDSKQNRPGDRFTAEVTTPGAYEGAIVEGHIDKLNPSGKVSGRTELALAFDSIRLRDRNADLTASLERIIESETVKEVDEEGNVKTGSRTKDSQTRGAIGGAAGAIIGGIAGGVKGAVLGAVIGGAAGVGTVYIEGNKELILDPGTEMVIRTERGRAR